MKRILSIALVFVLCLTMLAACGNDKKDGGKDKGTTTTTTTTAPADDELTVDDVKESLIAQYQKGSASEPMIVKEAFKVYAMFQGFKIDWTIDVTEGVAEGIAVEAIEGDAVNVNVTIPATAPEADVFFTLKGTISDDDGNSATVEFLYKIAAAIKDPEADSELSIADAVALGSSKVSDTYTSGKYYVTGEISLIDDEYYGNMVIKDDQGNKLTVYGSWGPDGKDRIKQLDPMPKVGDTVKLYGIIGQFKDTAQMKNAWIKEINGKKPGKAATTTRPSADIPSANSTVTVKQAIDIAMSKEHDKYTSDKFYLTATVTEVYNEQYGNMKVKDSDGNILTIYGSYSADGKHRYDVLKTQVKANDTIKLYGVLGQYNEVAQMKNAWIIEVNGKAPEVDPAKTTTVPKQDITLVSNPVVDKAYKFGMIQENVSTETVHFLVGGMNGYYMATGTSADNAIDVYLEETTGGYYLYTKSGSTKQYINMVVSGTHVNGAYESSAKTVYRYDATSKTLIADVDGADYWFGTRNDKTYTTVGPCKTSYNGFYCMFYEA